MALLELGIPWGRQPQEAVDPDHALRLGMLASGASQGIDSLGLGPITQGNASNLFQQVARSVGLCFAPGGATLQNSYAIVPRQREMGATIGSSFFWYGEISAAATLSGRSVLAGRYNDTTLSATRQGQFRLRAETTGALVVDVHVGTAIRTFTSALMVQYGQPLAVLLRFTASGVEIVSSVGSESGALADMVASVGTTTAGVVATIGSSSATFSGHHFQATALTAWSPEYLPEYLVQDPWRIFEPLRLHVQVPAAGPQAESGGASAAVTVTAVGSGTATEAASGGASATVTVSAAGDGIESAGEAGGASALVIVTAAGDGTATEQASGGGSALVLVTAAGGTFATEPDLAQQGIAADDYVAAVERTVAARAIEKQNEVVIQLVMAAVISGALQ